MHGYCPETDRSLNLFLQTITENYLSASGICTRVVTEHWIHHVIHPESITHPVHRRLHDTELCVTIPFLLGVITPFSESFGSVPFQRSHDELLSKPGVFERALIGHPSLTAVFETTCHFDQ